MASAPQLVLTWLAEHRRRLAPAVLVVGVVLVINPLARTAPRRTHLRLKLAEPQGVRTVTLSVLDAGEPILGVRLAYAAGAPDRIFEELELRAGHYDVRVDVTRVGDADGPPATAVRALDVPAEGTVVLDLSRGDA